MVLNNWLALYNDANCPSQLCRSAPELRFLLDTISSLPCCCCISSIVSNLPSVCSALLLLFALAEKSWEGDVGRSLQTAWLRRRPLSTFLCCPPLLLLSLASSSSYSDIFLFAPVPKRRRSMKRSKTLRVCCDPCRRPVAPLCCRKRRIVVCRRPLPHPPSPPPFPFPRSIRTVHNAFCAVTSLLFLHSDCRVTIPSHLLPPSFFVHSRCRPLLSSSPLI